MKRRGVSRCRLLLGVGAGLLLGLGCAAGPAPLPKTGARPGQEGPGGAPGVTTTEAPGASGTTTEAAAVEGPKAAATGFAPAAAALRLEPETYGAPSRPPTEEEATFLAAYLPHLVYLVYPAESPDLEGGLGKLAATQAIRYLTDKGGCAVIPYDAVEAAATAGRDAYRAAHGNLDGFTADLARRLGADVAVELSLQAQGEQREGRYYASFPGSLGVYDPGTATLLARLDFPGQAGMSPSSSAAAQSSAVAFSVWAGLAARLPSLRSLAEGLLGRGLRYEVAIRAEWRPAEVAAFEAALAPGVLDLGLASASPGEAVFHLHALEATDALGVRIAEASSAAGLRAPLLSRPGPRSWLVTGGGK